MSAATRAAAPTTRWRRPAVSGLASTCTSRGTRCHRASAAAALAGIRNHQHARQSIATVRSPPTTGPIRLAMPELAPQMPSAEPRRCAGKPDTAPASEAGLTSPAPMPCTTREAISTSRLPASAPIRAPAPNTASPASPTWRDPMRSTSVPPGKSASA
ncbi:MAG TPA: hypothetical protein VFB51_11930 [Solirubrobacterales bacterium]|nr:hypothetical protein [Solirubrobacterales bacterium]